MFLAAALCLLAGSPTEQVYEIPWEPGPISPRTIEIERSPLPLASVTVRLKIEWAPVYRILTAGSPVWVSGGAVGVLELPGHAVSVVGSHDWIGPYTVTTTATGYGRFVRTMTLTGSETLDALEGEGSLAVDIEGWSWFAVLAGGPGWRVKSDWTGAMEIGITYNLEEPDS